MLSSVGHDLRLRVGSWWLDVELDPPSARGEFDTGSLEVVGILEGDRIDTAQLSDRDRHEVERRVRDEVLEARRYPKAAFRATRLTARTGGYQLRGFLNLHGIERQLDVPVNVADGRAQVRATLDHTVFGIRPVKAFLGALRVKTDAEVSIELTLA